MRILYVAALGFWLGAGLFFIVVATAILRGLGQSAGQALELLFPHYYLFTTAVAVIAVVAGVVSGSARLPWPWVLPAAALALQIYGWVVLLPAVHRAEGTPAFGRLHGMSLGSDLVTLLLVAAALILQLAG